MKRVVLTFVLLNLLIMVHGNDKACIKPCLIQYREGYGQLRCPANYNLLVRTEMFQLFPMAEFTQWLIDSLGHQESSLILGTERDMVNKTLSDHYLHMFFCAPSDDFLYYCQCYNHRKRCTWCEMPSCWKYYGGVGACNSIDRSANECPRPRSANSSLDPLPLCTNPCVGIGGKIAGSIAGGFALGTLFVTVIAIILIRKDVYKRNQYSRPSFRKGGSNDNPLSDTSTCAYTPLQLEPGDEATLQE